MQYSVCVDALYMNKDFFSGMKEISSIGFKDFEFWTWWDKDLDKLVELKKELNMNVVACCTKFVSLTDPSVRASYIEGLKQSIEAAQKIEAKTLISQVGNDTLSSRESQQKSIVDGLKEAAPLLEKSGITLVIEPLNTTVDHKGYYLYSSEQGFEITKEVNSPNVKLLFDIYHQQIMEGDVIRRFSANIDLIGHFHAAGNPGRNELNIGELNYANILSAINKTGYTGHIGLEYFPINDPKIGLSELV